ncbi:MAG: hypothetical protein KAI89_10790 [Emcibacter sp.]|nr:hypothetical protein [Emcibacter sp.]
MAKEKYTLKQKEMLFKAQKIIDKAGSHYKEILEQHIQKLNQTINSGKMEEAIYICHLIQSQAGTFEWTLATEISGWFKRLLKEQQGKQPNPQINTLFLDSFDVIMRRDLKGDSELSVKLLTHIENELKKQHIR